MVNFVPAVAYHICLALPAAFTQPGIHLLAEPCSSSVDSPLGRLPLQVMRIFGTLFLVIFTFPANVVATVPLVVGIVWVFRAYISISRLFRGGIRSILSPNVFL